MSESPQRPSYSPVRTASSTSAWPLVGQLEMEPVHEGDVAQRQSPEGEEVEPPRPSPFHTRRRVPAEPLRRLCRPGSKPPTFGAVRFSASKRLNPSKYVCISADSAEADVLELLLTTWRLRRPEVLISVTGAASGSPLMDHKQQLVFRRGLLKAARRTRACETSGTQTHAPELHPSGFCSNLHALAHSRFHHS
jgi:hypothetical protein